MVLSGNKQRGFISKEEASSPTACTEAIMLTSVVDAKDKRDVATVDIPNALLQAVILDAEKDYHVMVQPHGEIVDIQCDIAPDVYLEYVTTNKKGEKILIVQCMKALYGTMVASLLCYKKCVSSLPRNGFRMNPYNPCLETNWWMVKY